MSSLEFPMMRKGLTLVLTAPAFEEDFLRLKEGVELMVIRPRRARSIKQNNAFHAVLGDLIKAGVWTGSIESFKQMIKFRMNWGDWYPTSDGRAIFVSHSTPDDQTEFNEFAERAKDVLVQHFNVRSDDLDALFRKWSKEGKEAREMAEAPEAVEAAKNDLEDQLMLLAVALDADSTADVEAAWKKQWAKQEIKMLHTIAETAVKDIVTAARAHARGRFSRREFNDRIEAVINKALGKE